MIKIMTMATIMTMTTTIMIDEDDDEKNYDYDDADHIQSVSFVIEVSFLFYSIFCSVLPPYSLSGIGLGRIGGLKYSDE